MSDIGQTRSEADAVLKEFYIPGMKEQLNNEVFLLTQMEMNTTDIEGRRAVLGIHTGRNEGVGARAELGTLPTAGRQGYAEERVALHYLYGRMQLSGPVIRSMGSDRGSFIRAVESETSGLVRDTRNDTNRQMYGDGTGVIATVAAGGPSATVTIQNPNSNLMRQLRAGMTVDIGSAPATPTDVVAGAVVISVDRSAGTLVLDQSVTTGAGDGIYRQGSGGTGATQKEITGLKAQVSSTGALWNIDPAVHEVWASYEATGVGAASEEMFMLASQEVNAESGLGINLWITTSQVHRDVAALLTTYKRFNEPLQLQGGYAALDMSDVSQGQTGANRVAMVWEKDMVEDGVAYGLTTDTWNIFAMSDWEFMQEDGAVLNRVPNTDAYEGTLFRYLELATHQRNANAKISGIT
jgi:hypothetical protein